jgi:signal transduction histidine kinase
VLRHAPGARTVLQIRHENDAVEVVVSDDGARSGIGQAGEAVTAANGGHGLVGMRERTGMFGGTLAAGPVPGGGFAVRARFPIARGWQ